MRMSGGHGLPHATTVVGRGTCAGTLLLVPGGYDNDPWPEAQEMGRNRGGTGNLSPGPAFDKVLAAAQTGAGWAFTRLYEWLAPVVSRYLRARGARDPDDLTSEAFVRVFSGCRSFSGDEAQFRSWVLRIAHCRLVDARRAQNRRPQSPSTPSVARSSTNRRPLPPKTRRCGAWGPSG